MAASCGRWRAARSRTRRISTPRPTHAQTGGFRAHAQTGGNGAHAQTGGYSAHAQTTGHASIAAALGIEGRASASAGGAIVLAEYAWDAATRRYDIVAVFAAKVGEHGIEPDVWYALKDGKPVAVAQSEGARDV